MRDKLRKLVMEMLDQEVELRVAVREFEQLYIEEALGRTEGNASRAADTLGVHRNTLRSKMTPPPTKKRKARSRRPTTGRKRKA